MHGGEDRNAESGDDGQGADRVGKAAAETGLAGRVLALSGGDYRAHDALGDLACVDAGAAHRFPHGETDVERIVRVESGQFRHLLRCRVHEIDQPDLTRDDELHRSRGRHGFRNPPRTHVKARA